MPSPGLWPGKWASPARTMWRWPNAMPLAISVPSLLKVNYNVCSMYQNLASKSFWITASIPVKFAPDEDKKKAALEKFNGKLDGFIKNIEKILEDNGGEWMVGKDFTWADLYVSITLHHVILMPF